MVDNADNILDRDEELRQWFSIPKMDLKTAKHLADTMRPSPDEVICNLCQQTVEKYLKGFLFFNNINPPKIHDLLKLLKMCSDISQDFSKFTKQCGFLDRYGVLPKYPNDLQINDDDVKASIRFAEAIEKFVLEKTGRSE